MRTKALMIINVALFLTAIILVLHLFEVELPTLGKAQYWLDESEPICVASFGEQKSLLDMSSCCYGLQVQLACENWGELMIVGGEELRVNKRCYTGKGTIDYFVNTKAYNLCKNQGYLSHKIF